MRREDLICDKKVVSGVALLSCLAAPTTTCLAKKSVERPNIVCVVSEDNFKGYMSIFTDGKYGANTPAIESLAREGVIFGNCYSNAPVSSAARSTLISGCYGPRMASHYHRRELEVDMADGLKMFPAYLRDAGYYTANNAKTDYNIVLGEGVWDESSTTCSWRDRKEGQPFYFVYNLGDTHESTLIKDIDQMKAVMGDYKPQNGTFIQPNFPDTEMFRTAYDYYCFCIEEMDRKVGEVVEQLNEDGLLDSTIILYYGDNGGILPNSKGYLTEVGLNVPLVVRVPERYQHLVDVEMGVSDDRFVSFVDLGPTILQMAGVDVPKAMDGESIWCRDSNDLLFGYADRMGEKYDMVRSVRRGNYKYIRAFQPFNFDALSNSYRYTLPIYQHFRELYETGALNQTQAAFFEPKAPEALYDLGNDPYEMHNLADDPSMQGVLKELRGELYDWQVENNDMGLFPEYYWIREAGAATAEYGAKNHKRIVRYLDIANLQLAEYEDIEDSLLKAINSDDELDRYWALIVCSTFADEANGVVDKIRTIASSDSEPINRVRAAEYLALYQDEPPQEVILSALYSVDDPIEAALILNSMTMLDEGSKGYKFRIDRSKLAPELQANSSVKSSLRKHNK